MQFNFTFIFAAAFLLLLISCDKEEQSGDVSLVTARDNMKAEILMNDIYKLMAYYIAQEAPFSTAPYPCLDSVTLNTTGEQSVMNIFFGEDQCTDTDGRSRKGAIQIIFSGPYEAEGTVITITPSNYKVDDFKFGGAITVTNNGTNQDGEPEFDIEVPNGIITAPLSDYTFSWNSVHTRTWISGDNSNFPEDDVYELTGSGYGNDRTESSYSFDILSPITVEFTCPQFKQGLLEVNPSGELPRLIDYGSGECDNSAVITVNNRDYSVDIE